MHKETKPSIDESRRRFLDKASKAAVVAPAVALLLSAQSKEVAAQTADPYAGTPPTGGPTA